MDSKLSTRWLTLAANIEFAKERDAWKVSFTNSSRARDYWRQVRTLYSPEFMSEMNSLLSDHPC